MAHRKKPNIGKLTKSFWLVSNEIIAMMDWMPTLIDAVGEPDIVNKLKSGMRIENQRY